jgi:hypothetical protein
MKSPTQQTLKLMRDRGYTCEVTERWCPFSKRRKDLFGFIDVLCIRGNEIIAVQTTTAAHVQERINKINDTVTAGIWLLSPARSIVVHGWAKRGPRGKRKTWQCNEVELKANGCQVTTKTLANTSQITEKQEE